MGIVLVVDDEFGVADLIDAILTDEGHRVLTAANGRQGLEMLAKEQLDLVFLDYMMPVMDGTVMLQTVIQSGSQGNSSRHDELYAGSKCGRALLRLRGFHAQAVYRLAGDRLCSTVCANLIL